MNCTMNTEYALALLASASLGCTHKNPTINALSAIQLSSNQSEFFSDQSEANAPIAVFTAVMDKIASKQSQDTRMLNHNHNNAMTKTSRGMMKNLLLFSARTVKALVQDSKDFVTSLLSALAHVQYKKNTAQHTPDIVDTNRKPHKAFYVNAIDACRHALSAAASVSDRHGRIYLQTGLTDGTGINTGINKSTTMCGVLTQ